MEPLISWDAPEHHYKEKDNDWYWAVGIIALTIASLSFIFGNIIFGILIIVGVLSLLIHGARRPEMVHIEIHDRGIMVDHILYPFLTLESFWIDAHEQPSKILIKSVKTFMPYIIIYIEEIHPEDVRAVLLRYIAETEHHEPISMKILEKFGF